MNDDIEQEAQRQYYRAYQMSQQQPVLWEQQNEFTKDWYRNAARLSFDRGTAVP